MNKRAIFAIIRKDLKVVSQNKGVMLPIIIAPTDIVCRFTLGGYPDSFHGEYCRRFGQ